MSSNSVVDEQCGDGMGSIDIATLNGNAPLTYSWDNGATTEDISGLSAGTYTVTVTDANNCSETSTFTINNNTGSLSIDGAQLYVENCGSGDGSIDVTVSGGTIPYSYAWSNGETVEDIDSLSAGSYQLTVTDGSGCSLSANYTVGNNSGTLSVTGVVNDASCTSANGVINQTATGGNGSLSYLWGGGQTTQNITGLVAGNYTCTITDQAGCYTTNNYTVNQNNGGISISSSIVTNELCGDGQGAINITTTGQNLSFSWDNGATTEDISGLSAGNYVCTISTAQGCTFTSNPISVLNSSGSLLVGTPAVTDELCTNGQGAINMSVTNGSTPYTYLWSSGETVEDITGLSAGVYSMTVTDANGCSETHSVTVANSPGTLSVQSAITDEICGNGMGAINLTTSGGTTPYSYQWNNNAITEDLSGLSAGTYEVIISDAANCELTETYTLNAGAQPLSIASASLSNELCGNNNGSISIDIVGGNGPYSYTWSTGAITQNVSGLSQGNYQVTITDADACNVSASYTISNDAGGLSVSSISSSEVCGDTTGAIDVTVSNGNFPMTFNWNSGETTPDITGLSAGIYTLTLTDNFGCQVIHSDTVTNATTGLSVSIASVVNDSCGLTSGSIDALVTGNGPFTYQWDSGQTTEDISGLSAGNYTLTVTDNTGCSESVTANVANQANTLAISFDNVGDENCTNSQGFVDIEVTGESPFTYSWSNGSATQDITGLNAGVYTVTITDNNGCQLVNSYTVNNNVATNLNANNSVVSNAYCTSNNGEIDLVPSGGVSPYTFQWDNGQTTEDISGLSPGNYSVTITDDVGCTYTQSWSVITQLSNLEITSINIFDDNCGDSTGQITVNSSTADDWYLDGVLSTGFPSNVFSNLSGGDYDVSVSDSYGCTIDSTVTVGNFAPFTASFVQEDDSCALSIGSIDMTVDPPFGATYLWSTGDTTEDISGLLAGTYSVTVTMNFGPGFDCSSDYSVTINNISPYSISGVVTDENCGDGQGGVDQTLVSGSGITYLWSTGATTEDLLGLSAGTYTCIVTAPGGCPADTLDYVVSNITGTMVVSNTIDNDSCSNGIGAIDLSVTGGSGSYSYLWNTSDVTEDIDGLAANTYDVTVTDLANNCQIIDTFQVNNIDAIFGATGLITHASGPTTTDGGIDITMSGTDTYTYIWSNGENTEDISNLNTGTYTLEIISSQGCDTSLTFFVGDLLQLGDYELTDIKMTIMA